MMPVAENELWSGLRPLGRIHECAVRLFGTHQNRLWTTEKLTAHYSTSPRPPTSVPLSAALLGYPPTCRKLDNIFSNRPKLSQSPISVVAVLTGRCECEHC